MRGRVVIVHGVADMARSHRGVASVLSSHGFVADAYDRRGYGRTKGEGHHDLEGGVRDLMRVVGDGVDVVIGHSFGGLVALAAAAAQPTLTRAVVAYEPPYPWCEAWGVAHTQKMSSLAGVEPEAVIEHYGLPERYLGQISGSGGDFAATYLRPDPFPLESVQVPTLVLRGEAHHRASTTATWLSGRSQWFRLAVIEGADHDGHMTHYGQVGEAVVNFLEDT